MCNYLDQFRTELENRNYSRNTRKNYIQYFGKFLSFSRENKNLSPAERIKYFLNQYSAHPVALKTAYSSILFFYTYVQQKECPYRLNKIRKIRRLPMTFTKSEIRKILNSIKNKKHKTMIAMLYGSGLRVSEVVNIRTGHLLFEKKKLKVVQGKGNKDRITLLSDKCTRGLKDFIKSKNAKEYVFTTVSDNKYSIRTVQIVFKKALEKSGIKKEAGCHSLRHSFATHLIEAGVQITRIRELLGHKSVKTTMGYLHVADILDQEIVSPL